MQLWKPEACLSRKREKRRSALNPDEHALRGTLLAFHEKCPLYALALHRLRQSGAAIAGLRRYGRFTRSNRAGARSCHQAPAWRSSVGSPRATSVLAAYSILAAC